MKKISRATILNFKEANLEKNQNYEVHDPSQKELTLRLCFFNDFLNISTYVFYSFHISLKLYFGIFFVNSLHLFL